MKNYRIAYANGSSRLSNLSNPRLEEIVCYNKNESFTVQSNQNNEIRFNNLVIGKILKKQKIQNGWFIAIERITISGYRFFDEIVIEEIHQ